MSEEAKDQDPTRLLATDARLIAEDDTHVVLALRISKQLIKDNLQLLATAMEAALDHPGRGNVSRETFLDVSCSRFV